MGYTADTPMCGTPQADCDAAVNYLSRWANDAYELVGTYALLCSLHGLDYVLALSQGCVETNNFSSWWWEAQMNPAGIGVTGKTRTAAEGRPGILNWQWNPVRQLWVNGRRYASMTEAVASHVGLLAVYCRDAHKGTKPTSLAYWARGNKEPSTHPCVNTVVSARQLGAAENPTKKGWAYPGNGYGDAVAAIANKIVLS